MPEIDLTQAAPDRWLLYSASGQGKTRSWIQELRDQLKSGFKGTFFVLDPDDGTRKNVQSDIKTLKNHLRYYLPTNYNETLHDFVAIKKQLKPGDFFVAEMLGSQWNSAQDSYIRNTEDAELISEVLIERKKDAEKAEESARKLAEQNKQTRPGKGPQPINAATGDLGAWPIINKSYEGDFLEQVKLLPRTHGTTVICTAESEEIRTKGKYVDEESVRDMFGPVGYKPSGQKRNPYRFDYILYLDRSGGKYSFTPVKVRDDQANVAKDFLYHRYDVELGEGVIKTFRDTLNMLG